MITDLYGATLAFDRAENKLVIIDQTLLPEQEILLYLDNPESVFEAIRSLRVRGAPAIGVSAAVALAVCAVKLKNNDRQAFFSRIYEIKEYLAASRPTAQNLFWALERMAATAKSAETENYPIDICKEKLCDEAQRIIDEDIEICRKIGENGEKLLADGSRVLTHCNAGRLAAVRYGTALAPVYMANEHGKKIKVFADETRPVLQGARLTAYELCSAGIDVSVICDNMAASLMAKGMIDVVITGADRIAANFDTANKIGTLSLAVNAKHFGIPFYIAAPMSTFDSKCESGNDIIIENRSGDEISGQYFVDRNKKRPDYSYNPAFDVTPRELISAVIIEKGIIYNTEFNKSF